MLIYDKYENSYYEVIAVKKIEEKIEELKQMERTATRDIAYHRYNILQQLIKENCKRGE